MNRFSLKQTLSNFATAVRETVDSVNKHFFAAAVVLVVINLTGSANAQDGAVRLQSGGVPPVGVNNQSGYNYVPETPVERKARIDQQVKDINTVCDKNSQTYNQLSCEVYRRDAGLGDDRSCDSSTSNISKAGDLARESCQKVGIGDYSKCIQKISYCEDADLKVADYEEENEGPAYCDKILANSCPSLPSFNIGADYRADKKDAESSRKDAKKELDDLMEEDRKAKADTAKQQLDIQEQQQNSAAAFRDAQDKLSKKMENSLQGISDASKKAFDDAQTAANQMEVEYVKMRSDARASADAVIAAQDQLQATCRAAAEKKYAKAESDRLAAEKKGRKNLGTSISGAANRKSLATTRQQAIDYQKYFTECTGGVSAEGVNAKNQIAAAQRAKDSADKLMADKAALIEKQRAQMQSKLQQMETDAANQKSKVVTDTQNELNTLTADKTRTDQQNQQRISLMSSNNLQANLAMQNKIQTANQELMKTQKEAALAVSRMDCAGRNAQKSSTVQAETDRGFASARRDVENLQRACKSLKPACGELPSQCTDFATWGKKDKSTKTPYEIRN